MLKFNTYPIDCSPSSSFPSNNFWFSKKKKKPTTPKTTKSYARVSSLPAAKSIWNIIIIYPFNHSPEYIKKKSENKIWRQTSWLFLCIQMNTSPICLFYAAAFLPYRKININTLSSHMVKSKFSQLDVSLKRRIIIKNKQTNH